MSTPQTKLNWNNLSPADTLSAEANAAAARQQLDVAQGNVDRVLKKAAGAGYGVKLDWNELAPTDSASSVKPLKGVAKTNIPQSTEPSIDQIAARFEVLKRGGLLAEAKPLMDRLRAAGWEVGPDYIKPPDEAPGKYPLWQYQIGQTQGAASEAATERPRSELVRQGLRKGVLMPGLNIPDSVATFMAETVEPLVGMGKGLAKIGTAALTGNAREAVGETYNLIAKPQVDQMKRAYELWQRGDRSEAIGHGAAALLPMFGPIAAQAGEQLGHKDIRGFSQSVILLALPEVFKAMKGGATVEEAVTSVADQIKPLIGRELREPIPQAAGVAATERLRGLAKTTPKLTGVDPEGLAATRFLNEQQRRTAVTMKQEPLPVDESLSPGIAAVRQAAIETPQEAAARVYKAETAHHATVQLRDEGGQFAEDSPKTYQRVIEYVTSGNPVTTAALQREFGLGYGDASKMIERLKQDKYTFSTGKPIAPIVPESLIEPQPPRTTGIANAVTEAERADHRLSPIETALSREWSGPVLSEGKAMVDADPSGYRATVSNLADNPRILTDAENAALTYDRMRLHNEYAAVQSQIETAIDSGDRITTQRLGKQLNTIEDAISENDIAAKVTGTEAGRGFNARKMMITEDYSLASLVQKAKVAAGKSEVPEVVRTQLTDLSKQIADLTTRLNKAESAPPKALTSRTTATNVVIRLEDAANAARARIAARKAGGQAGFVGERPVGEEGLPGGVDALADYATIGAAHLARIGADFATWSAEMVREFGDTIRPYLQQVYAVAKDQVQGAQSGRLATYKKGLLRRTEAVEAGTPQSPRSPLLLDPAAEALKKQLSDVQAKARNVIDRQAPNYLARRVGREAVGVLNLPRAIKASLDISAPGRQGLFFGISHPVIFKRAFTYQLEALIKSPEAYQQMVAEMAADPDFIQAQRVGKVEFTGTGDKLNMHEEAYMSGLADRIPGVSHSEQAYSAFLNKQRLEMWKLYKGELESKGLTPRTAPAEYTAIGDLINKGTGRGNLGRLSSAAPILNSAIFAPRWVASRLQLMNPVYYVTLPKAARIIALRDAMKFATAVGTTLYLAKKAGATVDSDPDSPDFAKIKVGNVHYDISGGFQQELKFLFRLGRSSYRTLTGSLVKGRGGDPTPADVAGGYLRNKLSPPAGALTDVFITGEMKKWGKERPDQLDEKPLKPTVGREALELFMPMVANDMIEAYQVEGRKGLAKAAAPSIVGVGVNTYLAPSSQKQLQQTEGNRRREIIRQRQVNAQ